MSSVVAVLAAAVLAAFIAAPLATIALFVPLPVIGARADGRWAWTRRLASSLVASAGAWRALESSPAEIAIVVGPEQILVFTD